jgi:signal transduction histidine kinase
VDAGTARTRGSTGLGLTNLRQRLARLCPGAHELTNEAKDGWVVVRLKLALGAGAGVAAPAEGGPDRPQGTEP